MTEVIRGTCSLMCPEIERRIFEYDENTKGARPPKADPKKTVKCYSRPAAGLIMTDPNQLRPAPVLSSTVEYLFTKIATRTDVDWIIVYDFIFDRLRAVRQDVVIQRIDISASIKLFESMVRFLVYAAHRLCERNISEFNERINGQHLAECVTHLLTLYDGDNDDDRSIETDLRPSIGKSSTKGMKTSSNDRRRMEALYILLNMGDAEALKRALSLPFDLRKSPDIQLSMKMSFACYLRNYVRVFSLFRQLKQPILVCAAMTNIPKLRRMAWKVMSSGYNSKVFTFPGLKLQEILSYKDVNKVRADCNLFGLAFTDENVSFRKTNFKDEIQLANSEAYYTPQALHNYLPHILLESV